MGRGLRWLAPVASSGAVAAYALVPALLAGHVEHPTLPTLSAAQLIARVEHADVAGLHGTVHESADLGLPTLPAKDTGSLLALLSGSRTLRVAQAGSDLRVAVLGTLQEQDLVVTSAGVWTYDSVTGATSHLPLSPSALLGATPRQTARAALAALGPTTAVTVDRTARIAGRAAYTLVLAPTQSGSLVARVEIGVDAATGEPLRTAVYAVGHTAAAFEEAFTSVSYAVPAASTFDPPTATAADPKGPAPAVAALVATSTIGTGWTQVTRVSGVPLTADVRRQLQQVSKAVPGGRLVGTALLSVLITPDGTAYAGAVPPAALEALAAAGR